MIVVTGAAGFIGSCIVSKLNEMGIEDMIIVDHIGKKTEKNKNIENKKYLEYLDKKDFLDLVLDNKLDKSVDAIIHMGACSSTTLTDAKYYEENNYQYTLHLAKWSIKNNARFIYASSAATYGDGSLGYSDSDDMTLKCKPLNLYGQSKQKFDMWVLDNNCADKMVGLKFFNVFGPNEYHKEDMRSVAAKAYRKVKDEGVIRLFKSYKTEFKDGEQKRDFIYVKDAVDVVNYFFENPNINGIYNVGTGQARSWNDLANALFSAAGREVNIEYFDMPETLRDRYQYFTQADMSKLYASGYKREFTPLEEAIKDYAGYLDGNLYL